MILTGKAKEDFLEFIHINEDRFQNYNFYKLDESMQNALIIEWLECCDKLKSFNSFDNIFYREYKLTGFKSRQEATEKAILKANEIYNERDII